MSSKLNVLLIDNFDSFAFNLVDEFRRQGCNVSVWRNDISAEHALEIANSLPLPRLVTLSPGPGRPEDAGCCSDLVRRIGGSVPIFGVCLGLQTIVQALGGTIGPAQEIVHGKSVWISHEGRSIFAGLPPNLMVGRYHSLVATRLPSELDIIARYRPDRGDELVMAIRHVELPIVGLQFHPESILTPQGSALLARTIAWATEWSPDKRPESTKHDPDPATVNS